ncbi:hypothetical protein [Thalassobius sp. I31.1]|uniref:hypothetical protein n=1 Tax=Thalassobius sp. I31.1 TaxID=2109912 RepID=UPI000D1AD58E|nr:hypothetical protein [Thalassobius sp. I31.1]
MKNSKIREILATVAPTVATALGGPLAGVATRAIAAKVLGREDASFEEVEAAITGASGADLVRLKELEYEFKAQMQEADIKLEQIAAEDRNSARQRQVQMKDWTPSVLGLAIIIGFFGVLAYIFRFGLPAEGSEVLLIMVGALGTMTSQVGNFFFGSSSGSKSKDAVIADLKGAQD